MGGRQSSGKNGSFVQSQLMSAGPGGAARDAAAIEAMSKEVKVDLTFWNGSMFSRSFENAADAIAFLQGHETTKPDGDV
jgi:hypothetical protein